MVGRASESDVEIFKFYLEKDLCSARVDGGRY